MTEEATKAWIKKEEGERHKDGVDIIYLDSKGNWTCGYGHLLFVGDTVPQGAVDAFFEDDYRQARDDLKSLYRMYSLPVMGIVRETALLGMLFQMGLYKVMRFKLMFLALMNKDWDRAADEMKDSKWAKYDSPARAERTAEMMRTGKIGD